MKRVTELILFCLIVNITVFSTQVLCFPVQHLLTTGCVLDDADPNAVPDVIGFDVGNVRGTISNYGEYANPRNVPGFQGFEYPIDSGNDFLFSAGIWVGAIVDGQMRVSTATDGDNGTREFSPENIGTVPLLNIYEHDFYFSSASFDERNGKYYVHGVFGVDDDFDWNMETDDLDNNSLPSRNWDGGGGILGFDDDGDGVIDEELANGVDDDGDEIIDEDSQDGDINGDSDAGYDPEPRIDEDPAGDMSVDHFDNDYDGLADEADADHDGDCCVGSFDDDGDGAQDEDAAARGDQEFYCVFQDSIQPNYVHSPDVDGHSPLDIEITQRSYAWSHPLAANIFLFEYAVRNMGSNLLEDVQLAFFADSDILAAGEGGDAGSLDDGNYYDATRRMMVQYDDPEDEDGPGPGVFVVKAVRPPIPWENAEFAFRNFERAAGGDPEANVEKFQMISSGQIDPPTPILGDWRMLMGWGAVDGTLTLAPGESMNFSVAMFAAADTAEANRIADSLAMGEFVLNVDTRQAIVTDFTLHQNFPNPFNPVTTLSFDLSKAGRVNLAVYDITGRKIQTLIDANLGSGRRELVFDGTNLPSGVYFYALRTAGHSDVKKMMLIK